MNSILEKAPILEKIWDLKEVDNKLYQCVVQSYPEVYKALEVLQGRCPVAHTCKVFSEGDFFRLKGHARSFCFKIGKGTLVFKGSEPFASDFLASFEQAMLHSIDDNPSRIEHFAMVEHEIFLAMSRKAALNSAQITKQFVKDYQEKINELPHVPIPLSVFMIPELTANNFLSQITRYLSNFPQFSVYDHTHFLAKDGLAIYVYYYPGYPLRVAHAMGQFPHTIVNESDNINNLEHNLKSWKQYDLEKITYDWVVFVAKMLGTGYVPTTWIYTGNCVQIQNLVMDGGMCDIDSVEHISQLNSDYDLTRAVLVSIQTLAESISILKSVKLEIAFTAIWSELYKQIKLNPFGLNYDSRIIKLFANKGLDMVATISNMISYRN